VPVRRTLDSGGGPERDRGAPLTAGARASVEPSVQVAAQPSCLLCGATGEIVYRNLRDELYGAPGRWNLRCCAGDQLWWLDPRPVGEDLPKLYVRYHTHEPRPLRRTILGRAWFALLPLFARAPFRAIRDIADAERMWLPRGPGRLLDVGAGDGAFVARMRAEGWEAEGVEPDPGAVERARIEHGVSLRVGTIDDVPAGERFDAVTLNNVIEHTLDPIAVLRQCWEQLEPNGRLVVLTPNIDSLGQRSFRDRWRGLEPPRHLYLFSATSLLEIARRAGVQNPSVRSTPRTVPFVWLSSARRVLALAGAAGAYVSEALSGKGEELLLVAKR
jgi:SAM-dependent methyltransferase